MVLHHRGVFEHLIEMPDGRVITHECPYRWKPPLVIHVGGVAYVSVPVFTAAEAKPPWLYVAL